MINFIEENFAIIKVIVEFDSCLYLYVRRRLRIPPLSNQA